VIGIAIFPKLLVRQLLQEALPRRATSKHLKGWIDCLFSVFNENGLTDWSLLTIFLVSNAALCSDEGQTEGSLDGSMSHVRREARRKVRT
jgi:hypothetical protein